MANDVKSNLGKLIKKVNPFGEKQDPQRQVQSLEEVRFAANVGSVGLTDEKSGLKIAQDVSLSIKEVGSDFIKEMSEENQLLVKDMVKQIGGLLTANAEKHKKTLDEVIRLSKQVAETGKASGDKKMQKVGEDTLKSAIAEREKNMGMNYHGADDNKGNRLARKLFGNDVDMSTKLVEEDVEETYVDPYTGEKSKRKKLDAEGNVVKREKREAKAWQDKALEKRNVFKKGFNYVERFDEIDDKGYAVKLDEKGNELRYGDEGWKEASQVKTIDKSLTKDELREHVKEVNATTARGFAERTAKVAWGGAKSMGSAFLEGLKTPIIPDVLEWDRQPDDLTDAQKRAIDEAEQAQGKTPREQGTAAVGKLSEVLSAETATGESLSSGAEEAAGLAQDPRIKLQEEANAKLDEVVNQLKLLNEKGGTGGNGNEEQQPAQPQEEGGGILDSIIDVGSNFIGKRAGTSLLGGMGGTLVAGAAGIGMAGYAAYNAYNDYNEADQLVESGGINERTGIAYTQADEDARKSEAVGRGVGGASGALAGAAAGAMIGSAVPIVGTAIGGLVGAGIGYFGGDAIGNTIGDWMSTDTEEQAMSDAEDSGLYNSNWLGNSEIDKKKLAQTTDVAQLNAILNDDDLSDEDKAAVQERLNQLQNSPSPVSTTTGTGASTGAALESASTGAARASTGSAPESASSENTSTESGRSSLATGTKYAAAMALGGPLAAGGMALWNNKDAVGETLGNVASGIGSVASGAFSGISNFAKEHPMLASVVPGLGAAGAIGGAWDWLTGDGENPDGDILESGSDDARDEMSVNVPPPTVIQQGGKGEGAPAGPQMPMTPMRVRNDESSWMRFADKRTMAI
jgi:hypothetical protein